jgi:hypothetical protein
MNPRAVGIWLCRFIQAWCISLIAICLIASILSHRFNWDWQTCAILTAILTFVAHEFDTVLDAAMSYYRSFFPSTRGTCVGLTGVALLVSRVLEAGGGKTYYDFAYFRFAIAFVIILIPTWHLVFVIGGIIVGFLPAFLVAVSIAVVLCRQELSLVGLELQKLGTVAYGAFMLPISVFRPIREQV